MRISDCSSDVCSSDLPLQGVSKYNYTVGLLYEKYGISGRLVYTYRSKYFDADASGQPTVRPVTPEDIMAKEVPPLIRSEEHTSELQSLMRISYAVFCLKKKNKHQQSQKHPIEKTKT